MYGPFQTETLTIDGIDVQVKYFYDEDSGSPWEDCDGHGPVRKSNKPHNAHDSDKRPGERPLNHADRHQYQYYYDWQAAIKLAVKDGWNTMPYDAPNRVQRAVQSNFDYLKAWVNDDWQFVGVTVQILDDEGEPIGESDSLWGIETYTDYHEEQAKKMATDLVAAHKRELAERLACEERDICTEAV